MSSSSSAKGDRDAPRPFEQADIDAVERQIAGVVEAAGSVTASAIALHNGQDWATSVQGANNDYLRAQSIELTAGRTFTAEEMAGGQDVCLIGSKIVKAIFVAGVSPLGAEMRVNQISCTVVGVLEERGEGGGPNSDQDNMVIMPLKTVQRRFLGSDDMQLFVVNTTRPIPVHRSRMLWSACCASVACCRAMRTTTST